MIIAIIQARMGSTRLLRKVARLIDGKTMLEWVIRRVRLIPEVSRVLVATSNQEPDQWIIQKCQELNTEWIRGPLDDVLARYELAVQTINLKPDDLLVRVTADCPVLDPDISSQVIQLMMEQKSDYAANVRDFPDGLDTEVFTRQALYDAARLASTAEDREHVTSWMRRNLLCVELPHEPTLRHLKWSVDTEEELQYVQELFAALGPVFSWTDILNLKPHQLCSWRAQ